MYSYRESSANQTDQIKKALETGALGIMVPFITTGRRLKGRLRHPSTLLKAPGAWITGAGRNGERIPRLTITQPTT